jgi:predicted DNA-binding protein (MmcQ/YjbR family)
VRSTDIGLSPVTFLSGYHRRVPEIDWIRKFCQSFPDATENMQWGENLCFKVRGKIFTVVDLSKGRAAPTCFKCTPQKFEELLEIEGISPAPYVGRYRWVLLEHADVLRKGDLQDLIRQSYELVIAKAPRTKNKAPRTKKKSVRRNPAAKRPRAK